MSPKNIPNDMLIQVLNGKDQADPKMRKFFNVAISRQTKRKATEDI